MTIERIFYSDWTLYLLPIPSVFLTVIIAYVIFWKTQERDIPKAIAVGIPIPLAASYFLLMTFHARSFADWLSIVRFISPHAYVLAVIGIWLAIAMIRGREVTLISSLTIFIVMLVGQIWTMIIVATLSGYS